MSMNAHRQTTERLGKRDIHYHIHRRTYGACGAIDLDMIDFNKNDQPVLLQELKHPNENLILLTDLKKHINIAHTLCIPLLITTYMFLTKKKNNLVALDADERLPIDHIQYWCYPVNKLAEKLFPNGAEYLTEWEYVKMLHDLRGYDYPPNTYFNHLETKYFHTLHPEVK